MIVILATVVSAAVSGYTIRGFIDRQRKKINDEVASSKLKKNISEPVTSFVETFKKNPRRFTLERVVEKTMREFDDFAKTSVTHTLTDRDNGLSFSIENVFSDNPSRLDSRRYGLGNVSFLTEDEIVFVCKSIGDYHKDRKEKYAAIVNLRARRHLTKIYKGEGQ